MTSLLKVDRINVRANMVMKDNLQELRNRLTSELGIEFSDGDCIDLILKFANDNTYDFINYCKFSIK